jgi:hypothetical protein
MIRFMNQNLTPLSDERRFDWLYLANPQGTARAWIAYDEKGGEIVGTAAAFPRTTRVDDEEVTCWVLADFAVKKGYRSLGPALALQKACLAPVSEGVIPFCYDHPAAAFLPVYRRLNVTNVGKIVRYVKLLKLGKKLEEKVRYKPVARVLGAIGEFMMSLAEPKIPAPPDIRISILQGKAGPEFDRLNLLFLEKFRVCGHRSASYLNWRYLENAYGAHDVVVLRREGKLIGFAVLVQKGFEATIVDYVGDFDRSAFLLLEGVKEILRSRGAHSISMPVTAFHPLIPWLKKLGFIPRESSDVVFYAKPGGRFDGIATDFRNWYWTHGDRDQ